ncbi:DUF6615 family protein [uncultured Maricaulis sp.]|uniref:DUF6615 family protein n=1 Tax=uncultured Maricaulis sp. TaxID=174710 RepID=UPI0025E966D8|nr:DUF6615 family protein [uncultured Maricaulis sp.]
MRTQPNFCRSFREEAHKVWEDMSEAEELDISRDEETTTQDLLLNLARKHRGRGLDIKTFSKSAESANGADWAFWFADHRGMGIGIRIQAKRLFPSEHRYKSLYHQSDKQREESKASGLPTPNQCETLMTHRDGLIPLYVFYNSDALDVQKAHLRHIDQFWWPYCFAFNNPAWGISAAPAFAIKQADWGKKNKPGDFAMTPWHCLFCHCCWDETPVDASLPSLIGYGLKQLHEFCAVELETSDDTSVEYDFSFEPTDNIPQWVALLGDGVDAQPALEEEMSRLQLKGVAAISGVPE